MNERIQALVYKADEVEILPDEDFCDTDFLADMDPRRVKIFAELLIQEVSNVLHDNELWNRDISHVLNEHFRVEQ